MRMELTPAQFVIIEDCLPRQRGNVALSNLQVLNAILFVAENGCKWRALPKRFGNWHTIYTRMNRWAKAGVLDRVFERMQAAQLVRIRLEAVSLDSTIVKVHPDGTGARKKGNSPRFWTSLGWFSCANALHVDVPVSGCWLMAGSSARPVAIASGMRFRRGTASGSATPRSFS